MTEIRDIDLNLRAIRNFEATGSMPALPDMVKLDLAANSGMTPNATVEFLGGLSQDLTMPLSTTNMSYEVAQAPIPTPTPPPKIDKDSGYSTEQKIRMFSRATANLKAPTDLTGSQAVIDWKKRAVRMGYLNQNDVEMDNRWDPAYNRIAYQMSQDDFNRRMKGNSAAPGASMGQLFQTFDDWLSPTGLMSAAVGMGFWWDAEQIDKEWEKWKRGDAFKGIKDAFVKEDGESWGSYFNPIKFTKDMWRVLGPVDDLLMPVINTALLFTGVGEVVAFSRATMLATKGVNGFNLAHGAVKANRVRNYIAGTRAGRVAGMSSDIATDITKMSQGGLIAGRIFPGVDRAAELAARGKNIGNVRKTVGESMTGWRNLRGVMVAKKSVQKGMQLGFVNRVEQAFGYNPELLPGQETVMNFTEEMRRNPLVWGMGEALFTPTAILQPGQIKKPFGWVNKFEKVGKNAFYSDEFRKAHEFQINQGLGQEALEAGLSKEAIKQMRRNRLKEWKKEVKKHGVSQALANEYAGKDLEKMGAFTTWIATISAIDDHAAALSKATKTGELFSENALRFDHSFHIARNNVINQLRYINEDDLEGIIHVMAWSRAKNAKQASKLVEEITDSLVGNTRRQEALRRLISVHNGKRKGAFQDLLARYLTEPGKLSESIAIHLETMGRWDDFVDNMDEVGSIYLAGGLDEATAKIPVNPETGMPLKSQSASLKGPKSSPHQIYGRPDPDTVFTTSINDVLDDQEFLDFAQKGYFDVFNKPFNPNGRFTVARTATPTAQTKRVEIAVIKRLKLIGDTTRRLRALPEETRFLSKLEAKLGGTASNRLTVLENVNLKQLEAALTDLGATANQARRYRRLFNYAKKNDIFGFDEIAKHAQTRLTEINRSSHWSNVHGIHSSLPLDMKVKALVRQVAYTATEVDVDTIPPALVAKLEQAGYKLVHGVEFAAPKDLMELSVEFQDIVNKAKYTNSLGTVGLAGVARKIEAGAIKSARGLYRSTNRWQPDAATAMYRTAYKNALQRALYDVTDGGKNYQKSADGIASADLNRLMDHLQDVVHEIANDLITLQHGKRNMARLSIRRMNTNVQSSFTPAAPADLVRSPSIWRQTREKLSDLGYTDKEMGRIFNALKESRVVGPQIRGRFTNMFDKIQSNNQLTGVLRTFGTVPVEGWQQMGVIKRSVKAIPRMLGRGVGTLAVAAPIKLRHDEINKDVDRSTFQNFAVVAGATLGGRMLSGKMMRWLLRKTGGNADEVGKWIKPMIQKVDDSAKYKHWAYIADSAATARDYFRFSLSPIFDASRYTEGMVLSQIGDLPEEVVARGGLRFNISPSRWKKDKLKELTGSRRGGKEKRIQVFHNPNLRSTEPAEYLTAEQMKARNLDPDKWDSTTKRASEVVDSQWDTVVNEFSAIGKRRHDFDYEALEAGTARFRQIGILGFNTQEWMASMYADLTRLHGIEPEKAYDIARKAFTYGVQPRSGMEMNINAVFFPFSFTKKIFSHAAKFLAQDWSRAAMLHDAVKAYDILNEEYDLNDMWAEHLPIMTKLYRLNPFAFGATMGEFGGANRPFINFIGGSAANLDIDPIFNVFLPQGHDIRDDKDMVALESTYKRLAPVFNDITHMLQQVKEQGRVLDPWGTHMTTTAEVQAGFEARSELRARVDRMMKREGFTGGIEDIRKRTASGWNTYLKEEEAQIREDFPAYAEAYADVISNSVMKQQEIAGLKRVHDAFVAENGATTTPVTRDEKVGYLLKLSDMLEKQYDGIEYVPVDKIYYMLKLATSWAKDDNYIKLKWRSLLRSKWGPIETELV